MLSARGYRLGLGMGIFSGLLWGLNNLLFSFGYAGIPQGDIAGVLGVQALLFAIPLACAAINDSCAALALTIYNVSRGMGPDIWRSLRTKPGLLVCLAAVLGGPVGQSTYFLGSALAGPAYALTITALYPIVGCVLARIFLKQPINGRMWLGIFLSVLGAMLVSYEPPAGEAPHFVLGLICAAVAAFCWGAEIVLAVFGMEAVDPDVAITLREITSGLVLSCLVLPVVSGWTVVQALTQGASLSALRFLVAAGIAGGFSYLFWYSANHRVGCAKGMATNSTFIIWGVLLNLLFGTISTITWPMMLGCIAVFCGVVLVSLNPQEAA